MLKLIAVDAASDRGVGLWIQIDQKYPKALANQCSGQIDRGRGFAHAPFLVCHRDDPGQLCFSKTSVTTTMCLCASRPGTSTGKTSVISRWRGVSADNSSSG